MHCIHQHFLNMRIIYRHPPGASGCFSRVLQRIHGCIQVQCTDLLSEVRVIRAQVLISPVRVEYLRRARYNSISRDWRLAVSFKLVAYPCLEVWHAKL